MCHAELLYTLPSSPLAWCVLCDTVRAFWEAKDGATTHQHQLGDPAFVDKLMRDADPRVASEATRLSAALQSM